MRTEDFDYDLPVEFIAQTPAEPRDTSRLLVLERKSGRISHAHFFDIGKFVNPGDLLVINRTRVIPARLYAHKLPARGRVEILLLKKEDETTWEALVGGKHLGQGQLLQVENGPQALIVAQLEGSQRLVRFSQPIEIYLQKAGHVPLPPYIRAYQGDPERYQTVYNKVPGSAAAPTAGLHFTETLMDNLKAQGIGFAEITLHVGLDTFAPVTEADAQTHQIHKEWCELTQEAADQINQTKLAGGRVIAVGTTVVRTLESAGRSSGPKGLIAWAGETDLFILPGFEFKVVDAMVTNFHLPKSTLIMLVSAFAGRETILNAYEVAKQNGYRFFSFGDAMLIL